MAEFERDIGRHDEAIVGLKIEVHAMRNDLAEIKTTLAETKGGVRTLLTVASIGGAGGAGWAKFIAMLKGGGG
jgi:hypothetical protein